MPQERNGSERVSGRESGRESVRERDSGRERVSGGECASAATTEPAGWGAMRRRLEEDGGESGSPTAWEALGGAPLPPSKPDRTSFGEVMQRALDAVGDVENPEVFHLIHGRASYKCWAQSVEEKLELLRKVWALQKQHRAQQEDITRRAELRSSERHSRGGAGAAGAKPAKGFLKKFARK